MSESRSDWGPLEPLIANPEIIEIMVNGPHAVFIEREGQLVKTDVTFKSDEQLLSVIQRMVEPLGCRVDEATPMVDARLADGIRINAIIPPVAVTGPALTIRKFVRTPLTLEKMLEYGVLSEDMAAFLRTCVAGRLNIVLAGGAGSGKTTFLSRVVDMIPEGERIVLIQDADEIQTDRKRVVKLESRPPNIAGKGGITLRDLIANSRNMRPDRVIVGEVRSEEAQEILDMMNTGHDGSILTLHAANARDVLGRLEMMMLLANPSLPVRAIREQIASALSLIVCMERVRDGTRKVMNMTEVLGMEGDVIVLQELFAFRETGLSEGRVQGYHTATGIIPRFFSRFREMSIDLPVELFAPRSSGSAEPGARQ
ncbi:MAG: CpaF family protein [Anaerolineae bacterium]|nr:CpaF family protein [Anaerolineae bacterium]